MRFNGLFKALLRPDLRSLGFWGDTNKQSLDKFPFCQVIKCSFFSGERAEVAGRAQGKAGRVGLWQGRQGWRKNGRAGRAGGRMAGQARQAGRDYGRAGRT